MAVMNTDNQIGRLTAQLAGMTFAVEELVDAIRSRIGSGQEQHLREMSELIIRGYREAAGNRNEAEADTRTAVDSIRAVFLKGL